MVKNVELSPTSLTANYAFADLSKDPELAQMVAGVTGFKGRIATDPDKPDGTMRKLMDVGRLADMGWRASIELEDGIADTYRWFLEHQDDYRG